MRSSRLIRTLAVVASVGLIFGAFVAPAQAGKKKKKKPAGCAAYVPGEAGAGQPVTLVTPAATEAAPATVEVELGPGLGAGRNPAPPPEGEGQYVSHAFTNLQVDSANPSANLYVKIAWEMPVWDYDVYLDTADGEELANSAGYGPATSGSDYAHSEVGSETIQAYPANDCEGYTVDVVGATTPGSAVTVSYWLGE